MAKKLTHQEFINRSNIIHNNKYDYSLVEYVNNKTKVKIICPIHGTFEQTPNNHLCGQGCKTCGKLAVTISKTLPTNDFINRSNIIHNNKYDYSLVEYINSKTKVKIICHIHGTFEQTPNNHLCGQGCKDCGKLTVTISKTLPIQDVITRSNIIHNNKYDYSLVEYVDNTTKVKIICPIHGTFEQTPNNHLNGKGCKPCGVLSSSGKKKLPTNDFINRSNIIHDNKYDYSLVEYVNNKTKVKIICHIHGTFEQTPNNHLCGQGCKDCGKLTVTISKTLPIQEFINRSNIIHNNKYDYSLVEYINSKTKVKIICPIHGTFEQKPSSHLFGYGCRLCNIDNTRSSIRDFIKNSNIVHNNKYDYSLVEYVDNKTKVKIICSTHGIFEQIPNSHLRGQGCKPCGVLIISSKKKLPTNDFINRSNIIHNNKYDYSLVEYVNSKTKVKIICPIHGTFEQTPNGHLGGQGCPNCTHSISSSEQEICNHIMSNNIQYIQSERSILCGKELDIYIQSHNLAIEFNGIYWHSERNGKNRSYHLNKTKDCSTQNIHLLHIFENEWLDPTKQSIWKSIINNKLGICSQKIFARKCQINEVDNKTTKQFLLNNHLQGHTPSSINIGLYYEDELISLMTFGKSRYNKKYQYELIRFCNKINTLVIGGASKIFKYFIRNYNPQSLISYADLRYSNGALYEKLGFNKLKNSSPNYFYFKINNASKLMSRVQFQKHKLQDKLEIFDPELTEYQNMLNNGYDRIWDCGNCVYSWY